MKNTSQRNLWIYALTRAVSSFGTQFQFFAVTSLTYALTGSTFLTSLQMGAVGLPYIVLARLAGSVADRHDPRKVTGIALLAQAILTLGYTQTEHFAAYLILNFLVASAGVFVVAAKGALIPQMVGKEQIFVTNARLASINGAAQLLAPAVAGLIIVRINPLWAFVFNSLSYLAPAVGMCFIRRVEQIADTKKQQRTVQDSAWGFIRNNKAFLLTLVLYGGYTLGMWSVNALFYPYCADVLGRGADIMGLSVSAYFGGFLITGLALERYGRVLKNPRLLVAGFFAGAVVWSGYTVLRTPFWAVLLSAFDGIVYTFTVTRLETWIQEEAPRGLRGSVSALVRSWEEIFTIGGQLGGGFIATRLGVLSGIAWSSVASVVLVLFGLAWGKRQARGELKPSMAVSKPAAKEPLANEEAV